MKNLNTLFVFGAGLLLFAACNDSNVEADPDAVLSQTEALDMVEEAISFDGIASEFSMLSGDIDVVLDGNTQPSPGVSEDSISDYCGETQSKSESGSFSGPNVSWSYQWDWNRTLNCSEELTPEYFDVNWDASRNFENSRVISSALADGDWLVTFDNTSSDFFIKIFNGDYTRTIDRDLVNNDRGHTATLDVNIVDVEVRRADRQILAGTLFFTLSGENNTGNTFSKSGEVIFNGDCSATINMDNGNSRTVLICN